MSISIDSNGRISRGTNVVIPPENAGIGDVVLKLGSNILVIGRGTITSPLPSGYSVYGIIYGFVSGMAMICAPADIGNMYWGSSVSGMPIVSSGNVLMRNGLKTSYHAQMNTARQMENDSHRGTAGTNVHPTAAYNGGVMTKTTFEGSSGAEARKIYGTWDEYLRQTLRVQGAPGSPFGAVTNGVKVHEFGRWMGKTYGAGTGQTALHACYTYPNNSGSGEWWLPSMFELGEMMIDEHYDKLEENAGKAGITSLGRGSGRWSCVLYSSGAAWYYSYYGMSSLDGFSGYQFAVRPVTLFKLK